jgi:hypothetical protein
MNFTQQPEENHHIFQPDPLYLRYGSLIIIIMSVFFALAKNEYIKGHETMRAHLNLHLLFVNK